MLSLEPLRGAFVEHDIWSGGHGPAIGLPVRSTEAEAYLILPHASWMPHGMRIVRPPFRPRED